MQGVASQTHTCPPPKTILGETFSGFLCPISSRPQTTPSPSKFFCESPTSVSHLPGLPSDISEKHILTCGAQVKRKLVQRALHAHRHHNDTSSSGSLVYHRRGEHLTIRKIDIILVIIGGKDQRMNDIMKEMMTHLYDIVHHIDLRLKLCKTSHGSRAESDKISTYQTQSTSVDSSSSNGNDNICIKINGGSSLNIHNKNNAHNIKQQEATVTQESTASTSSDSCISSISTAVGLHHQQILLHTHYHLHLIVQHLFSLTTLSHHQPVLHHRD